ncbi:hypothetical protein BBJ28_00006401, partial [Nothophytophthora sp. Chile5]
MREEYPPMDQRGGPPPMNAPYPDQRASYGRNPNDDFRGRPAGAPSRFDEAGPSRRPPSSSLEPLASYKVWMMRQSDEQATPEVYQQRYEEYKKKHEQRMLRAFFEGHKREEWLQERYSPALRHRLQQQRTAQQLHEAKQFGERVRSGAAKICLDEQPSAADPSSSSDQEEDFVNDMESSSRVLYVRRVPCACPVASLSECIKKAGGAFQHLYLSDPVKKSAFDFDRSAYLIYESAAAASDALPKIHNAFVEDADLFPPFRLQVSPHRARAPLKTPSYLSVPARLAVDYTQARALATALDARL